MFQYSSGDWNKRSGQLEEQGGPDRALPLDEGGQGQPGHEELQQARPPRFLHHLERQALS